MSVKSDQLSHHLRELSGIVERLRAVLERFDTASVRLASKVDEGANLVTALDNLDGRVRRSEVTEAIEEFEAVRHQVRLAMFDLAKEQGSSLSDVARALGIS
ncbi:MAG TPA: hypothetical protein VMV22_07355, partial [Acidimicrobiales bacterium]|nr:hypothetical protein [Acidimicrobiales bacterium]